jgi:hypothetical protein
MGSKLLASLPVVFMMQAMQAWKIKKRWFQFRRFWQSSQFWQSVFQFYHLQRTLLPVNADAVMGQF